MVVPLPVDKCLSAKCLSAKRLSVKWFSANRRATVHFHAHCHLPELRASEILFQRRTSNFTVAGGSSRRPASPTSRHQCYKTFLSVIYELSNKLECLSTTFLFQPSLMFVGKARSLPQNGAPERCFTRLSSSLAYKQQTRLEWIARDKHSSLLQKFVNYGQKKFHNIGPRRQCYKPFCFVADTYTRVVVPVLFYGSLIIFSGFCQIC